MSINFPNNRGYGEGLTSTFTYNSNGIVQSWYWGETGDNPVEAWIPFYSNIGVGIGRQGHQGPTGQDGNGGGGGANPEGPNGSIQFADSGSLSGIAEVGIFTNTKLSPHKGISGNFLNYTESLSSDNEVKNQSSQTKTLDFGKYNIQVIPNIALPQSGTLTIDGLTPITGASMTVILGHTGASGSQIIIPNMGIYWSDGPANGGSGQTAYIFPTPSKKKFDVLYFFSDGTYIFGNHMSNYIQKR